MIKEQNIKEDLVVDSWIYKYSIGTYIKIYLIVGTWELAWEPYWNPTVGTSETMRYMYLVQYTDCNVTGKVPSYHRHHRL